MSNASVNTVFAGESNPHTENSIKGVIIFLGILGVLVAPFIFIFGFIAYALFSWGRIKRSVILSFIAIHAVIVAALVPFVNSFTIAVNSVTDRIPKLVNALVDQNTENINVTGEIISIFLSQIPVSVIIGGLLGLTYSSWRWYRRPKWEVYTFRLTPIQWWQKRKNIRDIQTDNNSPTNGMTLGISRADGHKVIQTDQEASAHTLVIGASGTGKTNTLMTVARDIVKRGDGLVVVDLKNGHDVAEKLYEYSKRYNRTFRHFTMQSQREVYTGPSPEGPAYYDPIARGEASRRKDLLIEINQWSEPYYRTIAEEYLQKAFVILTANPRKDLSTLEDLNLVLDPKVLLERALPLSNDPSFRTIITDLERMNDAKLEQGERSALGTLRTQMALLAESVTGPWLKKDPKGDNNINLFDVAQKGEVVLFSLDASNYSSSAKGIGDLIIQDLKTVSSELRMKPSPRPMHVVIDEFSAIGSDNVIGLISKSRDAKIPVYLSTQALGDLKKVDPAFLDQLLGIINSFFIHRANLDDDAEVYAGLTGRTIRKKFRQSVEHEHNLFGMARGSGSGSGFLEDEEEYKITVSEIQSLGTGQMVFVAKSPSKIELVQVILEEEDLTHSKYEPKTIPPVVKASPVTQNVPYDATSYEESVQTVDDSPAPAPTVDNAAQKVAIRESNPDNLQRIFGKPVEKVMTKVPAVELDKKVLPPQGQPASYPAAEPNLTPPIKPAVKPVTGETTLPEERTVAKPAQVKLPPRRMPDRENLPKQSPVSPQKPAPAMSQKKLPSLPPKRPVPSQNDSKDRFDF